MGVFHAHRAEQVLIGGDGPPPAAGGGALALRVQWTLTLTVRVVVFF